MHRMRLACVYVIAFFGLGTLEASAEQGTTSPAVSRYFNQERQKLLPFLTGRFRVIGCEPSSGKPYRGSVVVKRQGQQLLVSESINGSNRIGAGTIVFEPETPTLEVLFGKGGFSAGYEPGRFGEKGQPRASGWTDRVENQRSDRHRLGMEVWYNDQPPPRLTELNYSIVNRMPIDLVDIYEGKYRVIGEETGTGRIYTGQVQAKLTGNRLMLTGQIDGTRAEGELMGEFPASKQPILAIRRRVGRQVMFSQAGAQMVGDNYPRICAYFYPVTDAGKIIGNRPPNLETWFFDWR